MPAQLSINIINENSILAKWIKNVRGVIINDDLGQEERRWFHKRWIENVIIYYKFKGFAIQFDLAVVKIVLRRGIKQDQAPSLATDPINANQTKYDIDSNLIEKVKEKAKRNVAKRLKKQQIQSDKKTDEDDDDEKGNEKKEIWKVCIMTFE